jgi:hypothetical protein
MCLFFLDVRKSGDLQATLNTDQAVSTVDKIGKLRKYLHHRLDMHRTNGKLSHRGPCNMNAPLFS